MYLVQFKEDSERNVNLSYQFYFQKCESALEHYKWLHAFLQPCNENFSRAGRARMLKSYDMCDIPFYVVRGTDISD